MNARELGFKVSTGNLSYDKGKETVTVRIGPFKFDIENFCWCIYCQQYHIDVENDTVRNCKPLEPLHDEQS
jgi:hypothetical protein